MDPTDPVYSICVEMADFLVPDVCRIIMDYLADIHIDLGRLHWKSRISSINKEYHEVWEYDDPYNTDQEALFSYIIEDETRICPCKNFRDVSIKPDYDTIYPYISHFSVVKKVFTSDICELPCNYVHAKLYPD